MAVLCRAKAHCTVLHFTALYRIKTQYHTVLYCIAIHCNGVVLYCTAVFYTEDSRTALHCAVLPLRLQGQCLCARAEGPDWQNKGQLRRQKRGLLMGGRALKAACHRKRRGCAVYTARRRLTNMSSGVVQTALVKLL